MIVGIGTSCPLADIHVALSLVLRLYFRHLQRNTFGSFRAVLAIALESFKRWPIQLTGEPAGIAEGLRS